MLLVRVQRPPRNVLSFTDNRTRFNQNFRYNCTGWQSGHSYFELQVPLLTPKVPAQLTGLRCLTALHVMAGPDTAYCFACPKPCNSLESYS